MVCGSRGCYVLGPVPGYSPDSGVMSGVAQQDLRAVLSTASTTCKKVDHHTPSRCSKKGVPDTMGRVLIRRPLGILLGWIGSRHGGCCAASRTTCPGLSPRDSHTSGNAPRKRVHTHVLGSAYPRTLLRKKTNCGPPQQRTCGAGGCVVDHTAGSSGRSQWSSRGCKRRILLFKWFYWQRGRAAPLHTRTTKSTRTLRT